MPDLFGNRTLQEYLQDALRARGDWASINDLLADLDRAGAWDAEFLQAAVALAKKELIRKTIRQIKNEHDWADVISIQKQDEEGNRVRIYKRESLFELSDYEQAVWYNNGRSRYFAKVRDVLRNNARKRFGVSIPVAGRPVASP